ncbi:uncharacterized protein C1orf21 homolog isoform X4 [Nerophis ophidion]|uniref:uncharacterized protein C1orf21 homolog isoform X4 n=1 Tax=Nerophis ophidion TaxID=159077 RepID=UPI002ADFEDEE|nr:uncharacterized protein C1orf21 homolog isoform X4 [Nerophis ophidion]
MGCTSAKQVSAVPNDEEGRGKAYSNGDLFADEYKMKGVEEVKYMRGEENREKSNVQHRGKQQQQQDETANIKSKGETTARKKMTGHSTVAPPRDDTN